jgi:hypothetical protein
MQRARLQARLGSKASREEKRAELTVPQLTALCGRYGLDRNGAKADHGLAVYCATRLRLCTGEAIARAEVDSRSCARSKYRSAKELCDQHERAQDNSARRGSR